ncbi:hypothetical protein ACFO3O_04835 [Dokdonia ponticola]|uniref:DUF3592 domain-containing protein n=1 Tax=Dokdonia ponticola TaxID=2041041 RepID=A0ABV9HTD4_9FLAO
MKFYRNLTDGKKSALIGGILILVFGIAFSIYRQSRLEKLNSDFILTEGTITEIRLNVSKGRTQTEDIFLFEFKHNGKNIIKSRTAYKPELLKVGQKFKVKVHPKDSDLLEIDLNGI